MNTNDVVVKQQDEIRAYENEDGDIVITQKSHFEADNFIYFNVENAEIIAQAILDLHRSIMEKK